MAKSTGSKGKKRPSTAQVKPRQQKASAKSKAVPTPVVKPGKSPTESKTLPKLASAWKLAQQTVQLLWRYKLLFGGIVLVYGVLNLILVQGLSGTGSVSSLKMTLDQFFHGHLGHVTSSLLVYVVLVGSAGSGNQGNGAFQVILLLMASLALIWALRQVLSGATIRIRDAYYRGMYPLVPFVIVLLMIGINLLPLALGATIYSVVNVNGLAVNVFEQAFWVVVLLGFAAWSLYLLSASLFASYIVTLPEMTPIKALRSAKDLVRGRRLSVVRKILFLPLSLVIISAAIMLPIILWLTPIATWVFLLLTLLVLAVVHGYMYSLYRELLND